MSIYTDALLYGKKEFRLIALQGLGVPATKLVLDDDAKNFPHLAIDGDAIWIWSVDLQEWFTLGDLPGVEKVALTDEANEYVLEDGFMIYAMHLRPEAADTIKLGFTDGGDEVMMEQEFEANKVKSVNMDIFADGADVSLFATGLTQPMMMTLYKRKL